MSRNGFILIKNGNFSLKNISFSMENTWNSKFLISFYESKSSFEKKKMLINNCEFNNFSRRDDNFLYFFAVESSDAVLINCRFTLLDISMGSLIISTDENSSYLFYLINCYIGSSYFHQVIFNLDGLSMTYIKNTIFKNVITNGNLL